MSAPKLLTLLIFVWVIGLAWVWPRSGPLSDYLGQKISETEQTFLPSPTPGEKVLDQNTTSVRVVKVIDGDTIEVTGGLKIRFIGVNTPETVDPRRPVQCFGTEAKDFTKSLLENKVIRLEKDISETDKYGRLLRYLYVTTDGTETFVNLKLVEEGYAESSSFPPDVKYQDKFLVAQNKAILENKGLWGKCGKIRAN